VNTYELQEIDPETGAIDILAEAEASSPREAEHVLLQRAGFSTSKSYAGRRLEIAWDDGRVPV